MSLLKKLSAMTLAAAIIFSSNFFVLTSQATSANSGSEQSKPDSAPMVVASRSEIKQPLKPNQRITVTLYFKNIGNVTLQTPVVSVTPSDSLSLQDNKTSYPLDSISPGKTVSVDVSVKTDKSINSSNQSLSLDLKYNYEGNEGILSGSTTDKIIIPTESKYKDFDSADDSSSPYIVVLRDSIKNPVQSGEEFEVTVTFKNLGRKTITSPIATFSPSDGLTLLNNNSTFMLDDISPEKGKSITLKLKAGKELTSSASIGVDLKYLYESGNTIANGSMSDKISIPGSSQGQLDIPSPNIIITHFNYGSEAVAAGEKFKLSFKFKNTSSVVNVENMVMTVESGEQFAIDGSTNTFYYPMVGIGGEMEASVPMQALVTAKTGAHPVDVSFKYEFSDGSKRNSSTASVKISIPIYQPDRFELSDPVIPETINAGEETSISIGYVNKSKAEVSNVEAIIEGEVETIARKQNLGNFESGKSGNIGFVFTPTASGEVSLILKVIYEDANAQQKTKEFPIKAMVSEPVIPDNTSELSDEEPAKKPILPIFISIIVLAAVVVSVLIYKKKKLQNSENSNEEDEDENSEDFFCQTDDIKDESENQQTH